MKLRYVCDPPTDARTGKPIVPCEQPGYYPGYSTLAQRELWDAATRDVILRRVTEVPSIKFFSNAEAELLEVIADRVIPQDDRVDHRRIPVVPIIDERLALNRADGYRYVSMPADGDAYRLGLKTINEMARELFQRGFMDLTPHQQDSILKSLHDGHPIAAKDKWNAFPVHRFWLLLVQDCASAYYSHPWAWDEIGFGGPAYPRGYMRLQRGEAEPWEVDERRYQWLAPASCLSDVHEAIPSEIEYREPYDRGER